MALNMTDVRGGGAAQRARTPARAQPAGRRRVVRESRAQRGGGGVRPLRPLNLLALPARRGKRKALPVVLRAPLGGRRRRHDPHALPRLRQPRRDLGVRRAVLLLGAPRHPPRHHRHLLLYPRLPAPRVSLVDRLRDLRAAAGGAGHVPERLDAHNAADAPQMNDDAKRVLIGRNNDFATRQIVYRTPVGIEVDELDHFEVVRKRVFYDDVLLVTYHREQSWGFIVLAAIVALLMGSLRGR